MAKAGISVKHELISKGQNKTAIVVGVASVVVTVCLVFSGSLFSRIAHQTRLIKAQESALKTLRSNEQALQQLEASFTKFIDSEQLATQADKTNLDTVRDALPSVYNYPNLVVNMNNLFGSASYKVTFSAINVKDTIDRTSANPTPQAIPLSLKIAAPADDLPDIFERLNKSIRPINIENIKVQYSVSGDGGSSALTATVSIEAVTHFLPKKNLEIDNEVVD